MVEWHGRGRRPPKEEMADFDIRQVPYHIVFKKLDEKKKEEILEILSRYSMEKANGKNPDALEYRKIIYELSGIDKYVEAHR